MLMLNNSIGFGTKSLSFAAGALDVANVFSADAYTGNSSTQTITNGVDLSGEGGMVWVKSRTTADAHRLTDTVRSATKALTSSSTAAETTESGVTGFNSDGFDLGSGGVQNASGENFIASSFRIASGFFDIVDFTGNGANRTISHNLGSVPGMIIVKNYSNTGGWAVYHRANTGAPETDRLFLDATSGTNDDATFWNDTAPTDSVFSVGTNSAVNTSSQTYVAYLFGHDAAGIIQCGAYTGNGSASGPSVNLGWEPQFLIVKNNATSWPWVMVDAARGADKSLYPNQNTAEDGYISGDTFDFTATGFDVKTTSGVVNGSSQEHIYMAIKAES